MWAAVATLFGFTSQDNTYDFDIVCFSAGGHMVSLGRRAVWTPEFQAAANRNRESRVLLWSQSLPVESYLEKMDGVLNTFTKPEV